MNPEQFKKTLETALEALEALAEAYNSSEALRDKFPEAEELILSVPFYAFSTPVEALEPAQRRIRSYVRSYVIGMTFENALAEYRMEIERNGKTPRAAFIGETLNERKEFWK